MTRVSRWLLLSLAVAGGLACGLVSLHAESLPFAVGEKLGGTTVILGPEQRGTRVSGIDRPRRSKEDDRGI